MERRGMGLYVVQVVGGQERHAADLIRKVAGASVEDSFVPELEVMKKIHGEWVYKREKLFTGYVFVKTHEPAVVKKSPYGTSNVRANDRHWKRCVCPIVPRGSCLA